MSAYYALRLYQRTMHNRKPAGVETREIGWRDGLVLAPLVACIVALAFYPQLILHRTDTSVQQRIEVFEDTTAPSASSIARKGGRGSEGQSMSVSSGPSESGAPPG
jgi:NADH:ubiquinone oxidoreductase subunit 4 (subunit M)